jgi:formylglycine-generating enzyme required for sulfatase activity
MDSNIAIDERMTCLCGHVRSNKTPASTNLCRKIHLRLGNFKHLSLLAAVMATVLFFSGCELALEGVGGEAAEATSIGIPEEMATAEIAAELAGTPSGSGTLMRVGALCSEETITIGDAETKSIVRLTNGRPIGFIERAGNSIKLESANGSILGYSVRDGNLINHFNGLNQQIGYSMYEPSTNTLSLFQYRPDHMAQFIGSDKIGATEILHYDTAGGLLGRTPIETLSPLRDNGPISIDLAAFGLVAHRNNAHSQPLADLRDGINIYPYPADAEILVEGVAHGFGKMTLQGLPIGKYRVTIRADGFEDQTTEVEVKKDEYAEVQAHLVRCFGWLHIESTPSDLAWELSSSSGQGLDAISQETNHGRTPSKVKLPTGSYDLHLFRDGWPTLVQREVHVRQNETAEVQASFRSGLRITSDPSGANVISDGQIIGTTPFELSDVMPGQHKFEVRLQGFRPVSISCDAVPGQQLNLFAKLYLASELNEGQPWTIPTLDLAMIWVPPGSFMMGDDPENVDTSDNGISKVRVTILKGFWLGRTLITQKQWQSIMGTTIESLWSQRGKDVALVGTGDDMPMYLVNWNECMEFCRRLTVIDRKAGHLPSDCHYTLPAEAEWEYACRAGADRAYDTGDREDDMDRAGWYSGNSNGSVHPVGIKSPNAWGFYDMHGNVWEWCRDWFQNGADSNLDLGSESPRAERGGCWASYAWDCRSSNRLRKEPSEFGYLGFRLALVTDK